VSLPPRTTDTMSDAIAIASPNGRMSKRAKDAAVRRLGVALFGPGGLTVEDLQGGTTPQPTKRESLLSHAALLRELAARGMSTGRYSREADRLEAQAAALGVAP
jgi:hypothetical protein